jgi:hypothetical protein
VRIEARQIATVFPGAVLLQDTGAMFCRVLHKWLEGFNMWISNMVNGPQMIG